MENNITNSRSIEDLVAENLEISRQISADMARIKKYMKWRMVMNIIWLILVIAPIILSLLFLPSFFSGFQAMVGDQNGLDEIMKQLK